MTTGGRESTVGSERPGAGDARAADGPDSERAPAPRGGFPACQRVRKRAEFLAIQGRGRRVSTPRFVLLLGLREDPRGAARLGLTVSRRAGNAVARNRAKRVLREAFRATRELWPPGTDLVVIVRRLQPSLGLADVVAEWFGVERAIRRRLTEARREQESRRTALVRDP